MSLYLSMVTAETRVKRSLVTPSRMEQVKGSSETPAWGAAARSWELLRGAWWVLLGLGHRAKLLFHKHIAMRASH